MDVATMDVYHRNTHRQRQREREGKRERERERCLEHYITFDTLGKNTLQI